MAARQQLKVVALMVGVLALAAWISVGEGRRAQGGTLVCDRAQDRCDLTRGWLLRDHVRFAVHDLVGAQRVGTRGSAGKEYRVEVKTRTGAHPLGPWDADASTPRSTAAAIQAFATNPSAPSLRASASRSSFIYVVVGFVDGIYALVALALLISLIRGRPVKFGWGY